MSRHARAPIEVSVLANAGAMHKYSAPVVPADHARAAHRLGLELQRVAEELHHAHTHDYRLGRQIIRMQHAVWCLAFLAAVLVVIAWAPLGDWWEAIRDLAYVECDAGR
jgi:hypothetical protein